MKRLTTLLMVLLLLVVAPGFSQTGTFKTYTGGTQVSTETVDLVVPQQDLNAGTVDTAQLVDDSVTADKIASDADVVVNSITVAGDVNAGGTFTLEGGFVKTGYSLLTDAEKTQALVGGSVVYGTIANSTPANSGAWTTATYTEVLDPNGAMNPVSGSVTAQASGYYLVSGSIAFSSNSTGFRQVQVLLNAASSIANDTKNAVAGEATYINLTRIIYLTAGQYIHLRVNQNSGATLTLSASSLFVQRLF